MTIIETSCLRLRPITDNDLGALARLWSDPDVMQYLPTGEPRSLEETRVELSFMVRHWQEQGFGVWAITLKGEGSFIGYCGIQYLHEEPGGVSAEALREGTDVEVVAGLEKQYWQQGIATYATRAALRYGFEILELSRIVAAIHPANAVSRHVLEGLGMREADDLCYYGDCPHFVVAREEYRTDDSVFVLHHARR